MLYEEVNRRKKELGLTAEQLSYAMRAHPTYSEGIRAAIEDALTK